MLGGEGKGECGHTHIGGRIGGDTHCEWGLVGEDH